jgi:two-component system phosphate regulon sensor histidine kinase PhoR
MKVWMQEFWRLMAFVVPTAFLGAMLGSVPWGLVLGLVLYLAYQFRQARRVELWLQAGKRGRPLNATGFWQNIVDITYRLYRRERKKKKKVSKLLDQFYESLTALPDAAVILDEHFNIDWFNWAASDLLGLRKEDIRRRISNLLRAPEFIEYLQKQDFNQSMEVISPIDESIQLTIRIVPFGKKQFLLSARNVTHVRQLERMREDFVANVSHELRTPLTVIAGYLEALIDAGEGDMPEPVYNSLVQMQGQSMRMQRLVEDLLQLSRLESDVNLEDQDGVSVPAMLSAVEEEAEVLARSKEQTIESEIEPDVWLVGDAQELHSAFSNLVSNAVRYTPNGGHITLRWYHDSHGAHFEVEDDGIGIEPQHLQRLTERFYRVDKDRSRMNGGTGLGLAIVKHVLQRHGATLHISSQPEQGTVFRCDFPVARMALMQNEPEPVTKTS